MANAAMNALCSQINDAKETVNNSEFAWWINEVSPKLTEKAKEECERTYAGISSETPMTNLVNEFILAFDLYTPNDVSKMRYNFAKKVLGWLKVRLGNLETLENNDIAYFKSFEEDADNMTFREVILKLYSHLEYAEFEDSTIWSRRFANDLVGPWFSETHPMAYKWRYTENICLVILKGGSLIPAQVFGIFS